MLGSLEQPAKTKAKSESLRGDLVSFIVAAKHTASPRYEFSGMSRQVRVLEPSGRERQDAL
jgi:hypothetical protein